MNQYLWIYFSCSLDNIEVDTTQLMTLNCQIEYSILSLIPYHTIIITPSFKLHNFKNMPYN